MPRLEQLLAHRLALQLRRLQPPRDFVQRSLQLHQRRKFPRLRLQHWVRPPARQLVQPPLPHLLHVREQRPLAPPLLFPPRLEVRRRCLLHPQHLPALREQRLAPDALLLRRPATLVLQQSQRRLPPAGELLQAPLLRRLQSLQLLPLRKHLRPFALLLFVALQLRLEARSLLLALHLGLALHRQKRPDTHFLRCKKPGLTCCMHPLTLQMCDSPFLL